MVRWKRKFNPCTCKKEVIITTQNSRHIHTSFTINSLLVAVDGFCIPIDMSSHQWKECVVCIVHIIVFLWLRWTQDIQHAKLNYMGHQDIALENSWNEWGPVSLNTHAIGFNVPEIQLGETSIVTTTDTSWQKSYL